MLQVQNRKNPQIVRRLLAQSRLESDSLNERDLLCPECGFRIQTLYSDASGHLRVKCPKCKGIFILNLAYFRRVKGLHRKDNSPSIGITSKY